MPSVELLDDTNRLWRADRVLLSGFNNSGEIRAALGHLVHNVVPQNECLRVSLAGSASIWGGAQMLTHADESLEVRRSDTSPLFSLNGTDCRVWNEGGLAHIELASSLGAPETVAQVAANALAVCTGCLHPWVSVRGTGSSDFALLRPRAPIAREPLFRLPVPLNHPSVWDLFRLIVESELRATAKGSPQLLPRLREVLDASSVGPHALRHPLVAAVEGLVRSHFKLPESDSNTGLPGEWISQLNHVSSAISGIQLDFRLRSRVDGALDSIRSNAVRAQDVLFAMRDRGLLAGPAIESYRSLRNPTAHGSPLDWTDPQQTLNRLGEVQTLLNRLVYYVVGYTGPFTDFAPGHLTVEGQEALPPEFRR